MCDSKLNLNENGINKTALRIVIFFFIPEMDANLVDKSIELSRTIAADYYSVVVAVAAVDFAFVVVVCKLAIVVIAAVNYLV